MGYYGGKTTLAPRIAALLPPHKHYVEPYCGSLAVLLAKQPADHETVNDLDQGLVTFWKVLRERADELAWQLALTPHSRIEQERAGQPADTELETARRVWVQLSQTRGNRRTRSTWRRFVNGACSTTSMTDYLHAYRERLHGAAERIADVSLECRPAMEIIADYGKHPSTLLYVDPPYLGETRRSNAYLHEMPHPEQHRQLAAALRAVEASVVLSGYPSPLYDELYVGWQRLDFATQTAQGGGGKSRTEVLWSNRPFDGAS
jgi:DNA adenine methylase